VTADKNPIEDAVEQAIEAFVYAPIGLLFDGPARFPKLVRNGKSQVTNARMMGQFAVQMGRTEVEKRASTLDGPVVDLLRGLGVVGPAPAPPASAPTPTEPAVAAAESSDDDAPARPTKKATAKKATAKGTTAKKAAAKVAKPAKKAAKKAAKNKIEAKKAAARANAAIKSATPAVDVLPIPDYDSLSASQVVSRLRGLTPGQLDAVRAYETGTRNRKTILNRVQQLAKT
jgi:hypothetical protein